MAPKHTQPADDGDRRQPTMHDRIATWCDCCTCEAEPYWADEAERLGIDLSDREPEDEGED